MDQFCEDLRLKLTRIDDAMSSLKETVTGKAEQVHHDVQSHLDQVERRIEQDQAKLAAAHAEMKAWVDERKTTMRTKIAEWKASREVSKLESRATAAERYAAAAVVVAAAAIDGAERAALEAWLAREDAAAAKANQGAHA